MLTLLFRQCLLVRKDNYEKQPLPPGSLQNKIVSVGTEVLKLEEDQKAHAKVVFKMTEQLPSDLCRDLIAKTAAW